MARRNGHTSLRREGGPGRRSLGEDGFTIIEFMIAMAITTAVLGGTVALATQIQQAYTNQLDDAAVEQEARFALDWIARYLRSGGSNPYACAVFQPIWINPNATAAGNDNVRIQADINPPDGDCTDSEEDVTIAHDPINFVITLNTGAGAVAMTDPIFPTRTDGTPALTFTYLDSARNVTAVEASIAFVQVAVTGRSEGRNAVTGFTEFTLTTEVRLRTP